MVRRLWSNAAQVVNGRQLCDDLALVKWCFRKVPQPAKHPAAPVPAMDHPALDIFRECSPDGRKYALDAELAAEGPAMVVSNMNRTFRLHLGHFAP